MSDPIVDILEIGLVVTHNNDHVGIRKFYFQL